MKQYKLAIVIGRFQILHNGHMEVFKKAFEVAEMVNFMIGSANMPRTINNPFTFKERKECLEEAIFAEISEESMVNGYSVVPVSDYLYDNPKWRKQIDTHLNFYRLHPSEICIVGGAKGEWYFDLFPDFGHVYPDSVPPLNATDLREKYFIWTPSYLADAFLTVDIPSASMDFLEKFRETPEYTYLSSEYTTILSNRKKYGEGPHLTCDNVILQEDKVLLVQRKNHPGKGLWAIPGGFLDKNETLEQGAFRELQEETTATITIEEFKKYKFAEKLFDHPKRSVASRIVTSAYCIDLPPHITCKTEAGDDAAVAKWFRLSEVEKMKNQMYDDHYEIIEYFTSFDEG